MRVIILLLLNVASYLLLQMLKILSELSLTSSMLKLTVAIVELNANLLNFRRLIGRKYNDKDVQADIVSICRPP